MLPGDSHSHEIECKVHITELDTPQVTLIRLHDENILFIALPRKSPCHDAGGGELLEAWELLLIAFFF